MAGLDGSWGRCGVRLGIRASAVGLDVELDYSLV